MKAPKDWFSEKTTAGMLRKEGVVSSFVVWWVAQGGLDEVEAVADSCSWGDLRSKSASNIGVRVLIKRNYVAEMIAAVLADPVMCLVAEHADIGPKTSTDRPGEKEWQYPPRLLWEVVAKCVGSFLLERGWWDRNEERIAEARRNVKTVKTVMTS